MGISYSISIMRACFIKSALFLILYILSVNCASKLQCSHPKGDDGDFFTEGCLKKSCKSGVWRASLSHDTCCYNGEAFQPETTITTLTDGCVAAVLNCVREDDVAKTVFKINSTCGKYSTYGQVKEIKDMLEDLMRKTGNCFNLVQYEQKI